MSLKEIVDILPNGFHDAFMKSMKLDFADSSVKIDLDVWMDKGSNENGKYNEERRRGVLELKNLIYLIFEDKCFVSFDFNDKAWVEIGYNYTRVGKPKEFVESDNSGWIYFDDLNSFVHFSASEINFNWIDSQK